MLLYIRWKSALSEKLHNPARSLLSGKSTGQTHAPDATRCRANRAPARRWYMPRPQKQRWLWTSGELKPGNIIPLESQTINTCPENLVWDCFVNVFDFDFILNVYDSIGGFWIRSEPHENDQKRGWIWYREKNEYDWHDQKSAQEIIHPSLIDNKTITIFVIGI